MSKKNLDPKQVEEFLLLNPDFLSSNSHILNSIEIVHETGGAVSLIQKQVEMLRRNYESTSSNLLQLLDIAKNNEGIFEKTKVNFGVDSMPKSYRCSLYDRGYLQKRISG